MSLDLPATDILSPSTARYDKTEKKELYRTEEVPEYGMIDIRRQFVEVYDLD